MYKVTSYCHADLWPRPLLPRPPMPRPHRPRPLMPCPPMPRPHRPRPLMPRSPRPCYHMQRQLTLFRACRYTTFPGLRVLTTYHRMPFLVLLQNLLFFLIHQVRWITNFEFIQFNVGCNSSMAYPTIKFCAVGETGLWAGFWIPWVSRTICFVPSWSKEANKLKGLLNQSWVTSGRWVNSYFDIMIEASGA